MAAPKKKKKNNLKTPTTEVGDFCSAQKTIIILYLNGIHEPVPLSGGQRAPLVSTVTPMGASVLYTGFLLLWGLTVQMSQQYLIFMWTLATSGNNLGKTTLKTQKEGSQNPSSQNQNREIIDGGIYAHNGCGSRWTVTVFVLCILLHTWLWLYCRLKSLPSWASSPGEL